MYSYIADVLNQMKAKGIYPDMVQIGNELNSGMLWSYGKSWGGDGKEFTRLATFLTTCERHAAKHPQKLCFI